MSLFKRKKRTVLLDAGDLLVPAAAPKPQAKEQAAPLMPTLGTSISPTEFAAAATNKYDDLFSDPTTWAGWREVHQRFLAGG